MAHFFINWSITSIRVLKNTDLLSYNRASNKDLIKFSF